jgi:hypothetical protein
VSPCLNPRPWATRDPGDPFRRTRVDAVERRAQMQAGSLSLNPIFLRTWSRKDQSTVSKAFVISSFNRIAGCLDLCNLRAVSWTIMKLSWRQRPRTKALWWDPTNCGRRRQLASCLLNHPYEAQHARLAWSGETSFVSVVALFPRATKNITTTHPICCHFLTPLAAWG